MDGIFILVYFTTNDKYLRITDELFCLRESEEALHFETKFSSSYSLGKSEPLKEHTIFRSIQFMR